jgi:hypothetical protein
MKFHYRAHKTPLQSLFWATWIQTVSSHSISLESVKILSSHICLRIPNGLFPFGLSHRNPVRIHNLTDMCYIPCLSHPPWLDPSFYFGEEYKLRSSTLWSFHHPPVTKSLLVTNILLSILFSNTLSLCSFFNVGDQVSHPYKTKSKIMISYIWFLSLQSADKETEALEAKVKLSLCLIN